MPRPKDKKFLTTEDQERIDDIRLAKQSFRLNEKNNRKIKLRQLLPIRPQNKKGRFQQKRNAVSLAVDALQTRPSPTESNPDRMLLPKTLQGLTGRKGNRKVARQAIKDIKWAARNAGPIKDRGVVEDGDTVMFKKGGKKKKKALKKATAIYRSGGFIEPPIEEI